MARTQENGQTMDARLDHPALPVLPSPADKKVIQQRSRNPLDTSAFESVPDSSLEEKSSQAPRSNAPTPVVSRARNSTGRADSPKGYGRRIGL